jgi:hypothetical protein
MRVAVALLLAVLAAHPASAFAGSPETYEQLKSLAGEWQAELPGFGKITSTVRVASNGKAIAESFGTAEDNELSVYTLDADTILLTHYCAMTPDGHQVRLQTPRLLGVPHELDFGFAGATNLHSNAAPHMRRMVMAISDHDHYSEKWTKTENGKETVFELNFVRR